MGPLPFGYNIDAIAACGGGLLLVGGSNFSGRCWTGTVALVDVSGADGPRLQTVLPQRAGIPAVCSLSVADEFTGRRVVASGGDDGSVDLWFISSNGARGGSNGATKAAAGAAGPGLEHTQAKVLHDASVTSLAAAPAVAQLASASADGTLRLWDCGQLLACTGQLGSSGGKPLNALAWTGEPAVLASAGDDGRLCLWDTRQLGSAPSAAAAVGAPALSLAVLGGGSGGKQQLVVGDLLGRVSVFDARNCSTPLQQRQLHGDAVHALAATSSSTGGSGGSGTVASGSDDGSILLLDCASLAASRQLAPAQQEGQASRYVRALAWSGGSRSSNGGGSQQQQLYCGSWSKEVSRVPL